MRFTARALVEQTMTPWSCSAAAKQPGVSGGDIREEGGRQAEGLCVPCTVTAGSGRPGSAADGVHGFAKLGVSHPDLAVKRNWRKHGNEVKLTMDTAMRVALLMPGMTGLS